MRTDPSIMLIAGEVSGDMHGARLLEALRKRLPGVSCFGVGGDGLAAAGMDVHYHVRDMAVTGLVEVLKRFAFFKKAFYEMVDLARDRKPDAVVLIDYPGFNLRFAARTHAMGLKNIYYVCPQVWAWNRGRIPRMARIIDRLITIFPFEDRCFEGTGLPVDFVGHPLVDEARKTLDGPAAPVPWQGHPQIALLPGSRPNEIERLLPAMWEATALIEKKYSDASFVIATPTPETEALIHHILVLLRNGPSRIRIVTGLTRHVLRQSRAAMVASGTATIEAALMNCPMVVSYRMAPLTYAFARLVVRVNHIGMVNIVAGKRACPELVQGEVTPRNFADTLFPLIEDTPERAAMIEALGQVRESLGPGGAEEKAAQIVAGELEKVSGVRCQQDES